MSEVGVIIPTTKGPVRIRKLAVSGLSNQAAMLYGPTARCASINNGYRHFVEVPSGLIEQKTGECRYVLRLSHDIQEGESWNCGALAAHSLFHANRLSMVPSSADNGRSPKDLVGGAETVIWATGRLAEDYDVLSVNGYKEKLDSSELLFQWCAENNVRVRCFFPAEDRSILVGEERLDDYVERLCERFATLNAFFIAQAPFDDHFWGDASAEEIFAIGTTETPQNSIVCRTKDDKDAWSAEETERRIGKAMVLRGGIVAVFTAAVLFAGLAFSTLGDVNPSADRDAVEETSKENARALFPELSLVFTKAPTGGCLEQRGARSELPVAIQLDGENTILSVPSTEQLCTLKIPGANGLSRIRSVQLFLLSGDVVGEPISMSRNGARNFRNTYLYSPKGDSARLDRLRISISYDTVEGEETALDALLYLDYAED